MKKSPFASWPAITATALLLAFAGAGLAGSPMICHPLETGKAELLPVSERGRTTDISHDGRQLTRDMQQLLSGNAPLLARMENIRRAATYAWDRPDVGGELLRALVARAAKAGPADRLAWFDAAYLLETLVQMGGTTSHDWMVRMARPSTPWPELNDLDGYRMIGVLVAREGESAELEFARGLMARNGGHVHLQRAKELAPAKSLLAVNVAKFHY